MSSHTLRYWHGRASVTNRRKEESEMLTPTAAGFRSSKGTPNGSLRQGAALFAQSRYHQRVLQSAGSSDRGIRRPVTVRTPPAQMLALIMGQSNARAQSTQVPGSRPCGQAPGFSDGGANCSMPALPFGVPVGTVGSTAAGAAA